MTKSRISPSRPRRKLRSWDHSRSQVPAFTMPDDATPVAVMRVVVREGVGTTSQMLIDDLGGAWSAPSTSTHRGSTPRGAASATQ